MALRVRHIFDHLFFSAFLVSGLCAISIGAETNLSDEEAIKAALSEIIAYSEDGDADGYVSLVTEDYVYLGPREPARSGKEDVRKWLVEIFDEWQITFPSWESTELLISGDLAVHRYSSKPEFTPKVGGESFTVNRKYIDVMRKDAEGKWLLARHMYNLND